MSEILKPETPEQVRDAIRWSAENDTPVELIGHGTKRDLGRPGNVGHTLDVSALTGISLYEPEELVLSAGAGTPMSEIEEAMANSIPMLRIGEASDLSALITFLASEKASYMTGLAVQVDGGSARTFY